jgi:hypothetical protein
MRPHEKQQFADAIRKIRDALSILGGNSLDTEQWQAAAANISSACNDVETLQSRLDQTHLNYSNQETAFADIFINNNQWVLDLVRDMLTFDVKDYVREKPDEWTAEQYIAFTFADKLKAWFEMLEETRDAWASNSAVNTPFTKDLQKRRDIVVGLHDIGSLHRVEWSEVARSQMAK